MTVVETFAAGEKLWMIKNAQTQPRVGMRHFSIHLNYLSVMRKCLVKLDPQQ